MKDFIEKERVIKEGKDLLKYLNDVLSGTGYYLELSGTWIEGDIFLKSKENWFFDISTYNFSINSFYKSVYKYHEIGKGVARYEEMSATLLPVVRTLKIESVLYDE